MQRLEVSGAVRPLYGSLGVKVLTSIGLSPGGSFWGVGKYCRARRSTYVDTAHAHCMLATKGCKHKLRICNAYFFTTAPTVAGRRLVTFYVRHLSCSRTK